MSDQLREAFRDLAEHAPAIDSTEQASDRTWRRARRAKRRTAVAAALGVVVVLVGSTVVGIGLTDRQHSAPVAPPYDPAQLAIPDKIWTPSPWTPGTDNAGPPGPLALIATAPRRTSWFHVDDDAIFGVSAVTGQYRFIDLPAVDGGLGLTGPAALSPDGTKIGYWLLGEIKTASSQPNDVGYAVYDTVTGDVTRHYVPSPYGLSPNWLIWSADSTHLVASFGAWARDGSRNSGGSSRGRPVESWNPSTNSVATATELSFFYEPLSDADGIHVFTGYRSVATIDPSTGAIRTSHIQGHAGDRAATVNPDTGALAYMGSVAGGGNQSDRWSVFVGTPSQDVPVGWHSRLVNTGAPETQVLGWTDAAHLLVRIWSSSRQHFMAQQRIASLDVDTGDLRTVAQVEDDQQSDAMFAGDLIARPFATRAPPQSVRDPRIIPAVVVGVVALGLLLWGLVVFARLERKYPSPRAPEET